VERGKLTVLLFGICLTIILLACAQPAPAPAPVPAPAPAPAPAPKYEPVVAIWQENGAPGSSSDLIYSQDLAKRWTAATGGLLTFDVHYQYELYKGPEAIEAIAAGALQVNTGHAYAAYGWDPRWDIYNLPMVFDSYEHMERFNDSPAMAEFCTEMEKRGTRVVPGSLHAAMAGMPIYTNFPVKSIDDLAGHDMRVLPGPTYAKMAKLLGTNGVSISSSELPVALQTGMVDMMHGGGQRGYVDSLGIADNMKYFLQPDLTLSTYWLWVSTKWFRSLPEEWQEAMDKACQEWMPIAHDFYRYGTSTSKQYLRDRLTEVVLSDEQVAKLRQKLAPIYQDYAGLSPGCQAILDAVEAAR